MLNVACFVQSRLTDADFVIFSNYCLIGTRRMLSFFSVFTGYTNPACGGKLYEKSLNVIFPVKV